MTDKPDAIDAARRCRGDVHFENVTFRYFGGGDPVLKNVSFEAQPGQTVALLGATGSRQDHASSTCCRASTTRPRGASPSTGTICAM